MDTDNIQHQLCYWWEIYYNSCPISRICNTM